VTTDARPYVAVLGARFRMLLQYRAAALAGFGTQLFWGTIKVMVLAAFFALGDGDQPMSLAQAVAYVWLGQALLGLLPWNVDEELAAQIRSGGVAHEMLRPVDVYALWYARTLAFRVAGTALRMIPMLVFAIVVLPLVGLGDWALTLPEPASLAAFLPSLAATALLAAAVTNLMHVVLVVTISGDGINRLAPGVVSVFAGLIIPLPLFPDAWQALLWWQPFRGLADTPLRLWLGHIPPAEAPVEIAMQLGWTAVFVVAGHTLLQRALRRLVVQGG
jgi:ABC-2 type transport system permease protein